MIAEELEVEKLTKRLIKRIPLAQWKRVTQSCGDGIDTTFVGFISQYYHLSMIIPQDWTVIDLGCAYAPQCFYFDKHKVYIGVDAFKGKRFHCRNTIHITTTIEEFVGNYKKTPKTFAICNYVPNADNWSMIRNTFKNLFIYFPE